MTPETTQVPGPQGAGGADGTDGVSAYSILTVGATFPGVGNSVTLNVNSSAWMVVGQIVIVGRGIVPIVNDGPWHGRITVIPTANQVTIQALGYTGDDTTALNTIDIDGVVSPAGVSSSPLTTKGDVYTRTAAVDARLGVGTNGRALIADSTVATVGLKYAGVDQTLSASFATVTPAATGSDQDLNSFVIPANTLSTNGDGIEIRGVFLCANATNKTIKLKIGAGPTTLVTVGPGAETGGRYVIICCRIVREAAGFMRFHGNVNTSTGGVFNDTTFGGEASALDWTIAETIKFTTNNAGAVGDCIETGFLLTYRAV